MQLRVLELLVRNAGQTVTKEQFFDEVWEGAIVEDSALQKQVRLLRRGLGQRDSIKTRYSVGYRFTRAVEVEEAVEPTLAERAAWAEFGSCAMLAESHAGKGRSKDALLWARRALELKCDEPARLAQVHVTMAKQLRDQGRYNEALAAYARAEELLRGGAGDLSFASRKALVSIDAGRAMVQFFLLGGSVEATKKAYEAIATTIANVQAEVDDQQAADWAALYRLHLGRQEAELLRQAGQYRAAAAKCMELFDAYPSVEVAPRAWTLLILAESNRLLGEFQLATEYYAEAESFARNQEDQRLLARVLRSQAELCRVVDRSQHELLVELREIVERTDYLHGKVYLHLIEGASALEKEDWSSADSSFEMASTLCHVDGQRLGIEWFHVEFGMLERIRLSGSGGGQMETLQRYEELASRYRSRGIPWGYLRAEAGAAILTGKQLPVPGGAQHDWAYIRAVRDQEKQGDHSLLLMQNLL